MVMIMAVAFHMLVQLIIDACVVESMVHHVLELVLVHVEDRTHEGEVDDLLGVQVSVLLHSVAQVRKIQCDARSVIKGYGGLDVAQHGAGLVLDPFTDLHKRVREPCLSVRIVAHDPSRKTGGYSADLLQRCLLVAHFIIP